MTSIVAIVRSGNQDIDGLLADYRWSLSAAPLRFGFPLAGTWTGYTGPGSEPFVGFNPLNATQQATVATLYGMIEGFTGASFVSAASVGETESSATLRFGMTDVAETAQAYLPYTDETAGDAWFNNSDYLNPTPGDYAWLGFLHEIGHTLGLKHPDENVFFGPTSLAVDNLNYTVMSYRSYLGMPVNAGFANEEFGYPQSFMMYDIAALQYLYGADFTTNAGDTVYRWSPTSGQMTINGAAAITPLANRIFLTVWDGGGIDTYDLSDYSTAVTVRLVPGQWSTTSPVQLVDLGDGFHGDGNIANALLYLGDTRSLIENAIGGSGNDTLIGNQAANFLEGRVGQDLLVGNEGNDSLAGGAGNDTLNGGDGNDLLDGGLDADQLNGSLGDDTFIVDNVLDVVDAGAGTDLVIAGVNFTLPADAERLTLSGTAALDGTGNGSDNILTGNPGNNRLDGQGGADQLLGGAGDDIYVVDNIGDQVVEDLGAGLDEVRTTLGSYTLGTNVEKLTGTSASAQALTGNALDNVIAAGVANDVLDGGTGADQLAGGGGDDTYFVDQAGDQVVEDPGAGSDEIRTALASFTLGAHVERLTGTSAGGQTLTGNTLDNVVAAGDGSDVLDGAAGTDQLAGGGGNDLYFVDGGDVVVENAAAGTDEVRTALASYTLTANVEKLTGLSPAGQALTGNGLDNQISGGAGADTLDGAGGADVLTGGGGNDNYVVDSIGDQVVEEASAGSDTVQSSISYTLGAEVENLILLGGGAIDGTGNALANSLTGNSGNNRLDGGGGADSLAGGPGNDVYIVDADDLVTEGGDPGVDEVRTSASSYVLGANVENLTGTSAAGQTLTGNALANFITGGSGNDVLAGTGSGAVDTLTGGGGNDLYIVDKAGDTVVEAAGGGTDIVHSAVTFTLGAEVENLTLTGAAAINGTGNTLANLLTGNGAANILDGGAGADVMDGGGGDDSYFVDNGGDVVTDNGGIDQVTSSVNFTLATGIEKLTLTGAATVGIGNTLDNLLTGSAIGNFLDGGVGADHLVGGGGDDVYVVDNVGDLAEENAASGNDSVRASISWTLAANIENLILTGSAAIDGTGNALDNSLVGNSGANVLTGGAGNDLYVIGAGDTVVELAGGGVDTVQSEVSHTLAAEVENLTLTGTATVAIGNGLANLLTGSAIGNFLDGGGGADHLVGGGGDDIYVVDNVGDVTEENASGNDTVRSSIGWTLGANLESLILTGSAAIDGTGNALDNSLVGNDGANILTGGGGNDLYVIGAGDTVVELAGGGIDTVQSSVSHTLAAEVENLTLTGTATIGIGNDLANLLTGSAIGNFLDGGLGADHLVGGGGDDVHVVDNVGDVAEEDVSAGNDTLRSSISWTLGANFENLVLTGTGAIDGTGNTLANFVSGNSGANLLDGGDGDDSVFGGAGDDRLLVAGTGTEIADGGDDSDTLELDYFGATLAITTLVAPTDPDLDNGFDGRFGDGAGRQIDFAGIERFVIITGSGNDDITTGGGDDEVSLLGGNDTANLEAGNDLVFAGQGDDIVNGGLGNDELRGQAGVDTFHGNGGLDSLFGGPGDDFLFGDEDDDFASGGADADTVNGGAGNDELRGQNSGDVLHGDDDDDQAFGGPGNDMVHGDAGNDQLFGGADDDQLFGGTGNDLITGGFGRDMLNGGADVDTFVLREIGESAVGAADEILDFTQGEDLIDLSSIDADTGTPGDQAFGGGPFLTAFSNVAGELIAYESVPGSWFVEGDVDGDGAADFQLLVVSPFELLGSDFIL